MEQITAERIKMMQVVLFLVAVLLFLGGCGKEAEDGVKGMSDMAVPMSGGVDIEHFGSEEWSGGNISGQTAGKSEGNDGEKSMTEEPVEISREKKEILYAGGDFLKSCAGIGANGIYLTGYHGKYEDMKPTRENYFWGRIEMEGDVLQEFDLDVQEDMTALRSCVDTEGNWHVLCVSQVDGAFTYDKAEIWVIDGQGSRTKTIDYMEAMQTKQFIPYWMVVDREGNYFLADNWTLLWIDGEGHVKKWYETDYLEGLGMGKSGQIYGVFTDDAGETYLGCLDPEMGEVEQCVSFEKKLSSSFSVLQPGVNSELLLANRGDGAWRYDGEDLELAVSIGDILGNGQDISAMGFLNDGRLCVMSYENDRHVFYYVPVEM